MKHISMAELIDFGVKVMTKREIVDDSGIEPIGRSPVLSFL